MLHGFEEANSLNSIIFLGWSPALPSFIDSPEMIYWIEFSRINGRTLTSLKTVNALSARTETRKHATVWWPHPQSTGIRCKPEPAASCEVTSLLRFSIFTLRAKLSGAVYCNRSWLWVCLFVCLWVVVCVCVCGSVTKITRNCVHRSSPNWVCR